MWDIMKKTYAILVAVIFLISVSAVFAADSSKEIFLGGVKFSVPSMGSLLQIIQVTIQTNLALI